MLGDLQSLLTSFYDLEMSYDIYDFLITDERLAKALDAGGRDTDEKLLIDEQGDAAEVSLYLHAKLLERLKRNDPVMQLNHRNLADFWTAFEGVSHFTYYAWKASVDMPVTLLEMELQAEIDKFVATAILLRRQGARPQPGLHHWLFTQPKFDRNLRGVELERYGRANYYAGKYCLKLRSHLARGHDRGDFRRELRRFYRLPRPAKIGHIESC